MWGGVSPNSDGVGNEVMLHLAMECSNGLQQNAGRTKPSQVLVGWYSSCPRCQTLEGHSALQPSQQVEVRCHIPADCVGT